jgi:hypothetical protein
MSAAYKLKNFKILFIIVIKLSSPVGLCLKSGSNCTFHTILCLSFLWPFSVKLPSVAHWMPLFMCCNTVEQGSADISL